MKETIMGNRCGTMGVKAGSKAKDARRILYLWNHSGFMKRPGQ